MLPSPIPLLVSTTSFLRLPPLFIRRLSFASPIRPPPRLLLDCLLVSYPTASSSPIRLSRLLLDCLLVSYPTLPRLLSSSCLDRLLVLLSRLSSLSDRLLSRSLSSSLTRLLLVSSTRLLVSYSTASSSPIRPPPRLSDLLLVLTRLASSSPIRPLLVSYSTLLHRLLPLLRLFVLRCLLVSIDASSSPIHLLSYSCSSVPIRLLLVSYSTIDRLLVDRSSYLGLPLVSYRPSSLSLSDSSPIRLPPRLLLDCLLVSYPTASSSPIRPPPRPYDCLLVSCPSTSFLVSYSTAFLVSIRPPPSSLSDAISSSLLRLPPRLLSDLLLVSYPTASSSLTRLPPRLLSTASRLYPDRPSRLLLDCLLSPSSHSSSLRLLLVSYPTAS
ncbi:hypothetical protein C7M84_023068 [Penaeus vannamei]|uniref:Uncharacterized protein n=1 Tax=Penaeus vannamei TaxID=6689 RepID=A0A423U4X2_PENVA|nr:hypothetical protein C7M84_023068 [Penaeus vannamei]